MIPVCTETTLPCGIVVRSDSGVVDLCLVCASTTCPRARHDGRTCTGGCKVCTCGGHE